MIHFDKSVWLEWHYNKAHHERGPMDGIGRTIKTVVFVLVKSNKVTRITAEEYCNGGFKGFAFRSINLSFPT